MVERVTRGAVFAVLAFAFTSCAPAPRVRSVLGFAASSKSAAPPQLTSVVLITLDGTRWQDVFGDAELMPTLHRWMTIDGVGLGAPGHGEVWATGPNYVSLPGYTEIFTGRPSACASNFCGRVETPTLVDGIRDSGEEAAVIASWERIERVAARDPSRVILSAGRHATGRTDGLDAEILESGRAANPWPGGEDYRPDAITTKLALRLLETRQPRFLFVGLGDPDEHAHHGDRAAYLASLRFADRFLSDIEARVRAPTVILVTADHGRSASFRDHGGEWPESGRVWIVAHGPGLRGRGLVDTGKLHLDDVAPTIRCLLGLRPDSAASAGHAISSICDGSPDDAAY